MSTVDPRDDAAARYIDAKADACRRRKDDTFDQAARILDALADEIRMGLHTGEPS